MVLLATTSVLALAACGKNSATVTDPADSLPTQTNAPRPSTPSSPSTSAATSTTTGEALALDVAQLAQLVPKASEIAAFEDKHYVGLENIKLANEQIIPVGTSAFPFLEGSLGGFERTYTSTFRSVDSQGAIVPTTQRYTLRVLTFQDSDAARSSARALKTTLGRATANLSSSSAGDFSLKAYYEVTSSDLPAVSEVAVVRGAVMAWVIVEDSLSLDRTDVLLEPALALAEGALDKHPALAG